MKKDEIINYINDAIFRDDNGDTIKIDIGMPKEPNHYREVNIIASKEISKKDIANYIESLLDLNQTKEINFDKESYEMLINLQRNNIYRRSFFYKDNEPLIKVNDIKNKCQYTVEPISLKYLLNLLLSNDIHPEDARFIIRYHFLGMRFEKNGNVFLLKNQIKDTTDKNEVIKSLLKNYIIRRYPILKIKGKNLSNVPNIKEYFSSFIFNLNLRGIKIRPSENARDFFEIRNVTKHPRKINNEIKPPYQKYDEELVHLYSNANWSDNPFTQYIMYYQILERYFNKISEKDLVDQVRQQLIDPKLSFKDDNKLLELCISIAEKQQNNKKEVAQLLAVLKHYISDFTDITDNLTESQINHFKNNTPNFIKGNESKKKLKFDLMSTNVNNNLKPIAERIYNVRNALVHNKSQRDSNYDPSRDYSSLMKEVPLIRAIAETIMIKSSDAL